jgi:tetratricopeptide (TPR) repeat protein
MFRNVTIATLVAATLLSPAIGHAQSKRAQADAHVQKAEELFQKEQYAAAIEELKAALALDPRPELLFSIAQSYANLKDCTNATAYFQRFIDTKPDPDGLSLARQGIVACEPGSAAPEPAKGPPVPDQSAVDADATPAAAEPVDAVIDPALPAPRQPSPWYTDVLGDSLVGAGLIAGGVATWFYLDALSLNEDAEDAPDLPTHDKLVGQAEDRRLIAVIAASAGGALVIGGVVRYFTRDAGGDEATSISVAPTGDGGATLILGGRF